MNKVELINEIAELVTLFAEDNNVIRGPSLITISVDYGLAPENMFPVAIMDALSVVEHMLAKNPLRNIHFSGESAGGNISIVAGLESFRKYPGRVFSIQSQCPMLDPAGDTMSYYMNQNVFPDMDWLRWCWRAYLGLKIEEPTGTPKTVKQALRENSNYNSWKQWKKKHSKFMQRLVNPSFDLPMLDGENAPTFLIQMNMADPMYDEEKQFVNVLYRSKANVVIMDHKGMHCSVGGHHDPNAHAADMKKWARVIFSPKN
jgi:acetyl esterase/lipase